MKPGTAPDDIAVKRALAEWRRKATNALLATVSLVCLPALVLSLTGHGPPFAWPMKTLVVVTYAICVVCALLRRVDHETRMWVILGATYLLTFFGSIAVPYGPFVRSLPVSLAIMALLFIGARAGRAATIVSAAIILIAPSLRTVPGLDAFLMDGPMPVSASPSFTLTQGLAMTAILIPLMILMEGFHLFLIQSLAAERRASASLEREMAERAADHQELEHEMLERQRLERALARISDEERRRLGQDVHDGVCQQLTGALLRCQALERRLDRGNAAEAADIAALSCLLEEAIDEAYAVARGLNPLEPEPEALVQALRSLLRRTRETAGTSCEFIASGDTRVADPAAAQHLYRIAQEALSNAVRHAQAGHITVELRGCENELVLRVEDDGAGMPAVPANGGMGLGTMAYRAQAMEGVLVVEPSPDGGTRVICQVPRVSPADEHPDTDGKGRR